MKMFCRKNCEIILALYSNRSSSLVKVPTTQAEFSMTQSRKCAGNSSTLTEGRTFSCRRPTVFRTRVTTGTSTCPTRRKSRLPTSNIIGSSVRHIFTRIKISTIIFKICYFSPGVLLGISIRTRKPISLNLAPMFWRMLLHRTIGHEDLEAIDLNYSRRQVKENSTYF